MDKIVSLSRRRGFVFPSSEIYGGLGSTYDYGHYGVLMKNNIRARWFEAMVRNRDDIVAIDSAVILHPSVWEASGHVAGFTDPLDRLPYLQAPLPRGQARGLEVRPQAEQAARRDARVRPDRAAAVQPDVRDDGRRARRKRARVRLPAAGDRAGHLHQLQERAPDRATQAAVRNRPDRQVVSQRDHARQLPLPRARVRADGDGVLRPAGRGREVVPLLDRRAAQLVPRATACATASCACASTAPEERSHYSQGTSDIEYDYPIGWSRARGHRESRRLRPDAAHRALDDEARVRRTGRRALRPVRDRARGQHRADHGRACSSTRTTRRSSASASEPCCACTRRSRR